MLEKKRVLGDYNIGKTIGQGAFSKVKIGFHIETNQKVAIKVIDKKQMEAKAKKAKEAHEQREKRARRNSKTPTDANVQLLMRLDHPNVIKLYQVVENEDECFVVMEYASGGELIEHIAAKGYLIEKEARKFFRQMTSALDHCHLANVVHRDLKLENLLLNSERNLLISDFGLGRTFQSDDNDLMKTFCGTPNYAAVELISGIPYTGVKSDIWAMGVVLYVMMTGRPPFVGENISQLYSKIKAVDYKCPDYFSADLVGLLKRMLVKDPKERASMDEIRQHPWVNFEEVE
ncbi:kinase-like domain-containing protein, partial [Cladochytrium replicatum]